MEELSSFIIDECACLLKAYFRLLIDIGYCGVSRIVMKLSLKIESARSLMIFTSDLICLYFYPLGFLEP